MSDINYDRFNTDAYRFQRDAYQIAENTPRERHGDHCPSLGVGALVINMRFSDKNLCDCWVVSAAQDWIDRRKAACTECPNGCKCYC